MYLSKINTRAVSWKMLCEKPSKNRLEKAVGNICDQKKENIWNIINHIHYHVVNVDAFITALVEIAVEEKVTFISYATPEKLLAHLSCDIGNLSDEALMFVYLALRDGERFLLL